MLKFYYFVQIFFHNMQKKTTPIWENIFVFFKTGRNICATCTVTDYPCLKFRFKSARPKNSKKADKKVFKSRKISTKKLDLELNRTTGICRLKHVLQLYTKCTEHSLNWNNLQQFLKTWKKFQKQHKKISRTSWKFNFQFKKRCLNFMQIRRCGN